MASFQELAFVFVEVDTIPEPVEMISAFTVCTWIIDADKIKALSNIDF